MKLLLLLYTICSLTLTNAVEQRRDRLDNKDTDAAFTKTDERGIERTSTENTDLVLSYEKTKTNRTMELKNTNLKTKNNETQHKTEKVKTLQIVVLGENYDVNRGKRELLDETEENAVIKRDPGSYLQTYNPLLPKHRPLGPKIRPLLLPKNPIRITLPHKSLFPKHHSTFLGSQQYSQHDDSPESILLKILSTNNNGNSDGFKNVELTKTVAYNVTKLIDAYQESNFLLEKKENLTVEMSYLDSQERETKYSNTLNSNLHKVLGPQIFDDEWSSEENINENVQEENLNTNDILSDRNADSSRDFVKKSKMGKPSMSDYIPEVPSEFVDGSFVGSGLKNSVYSPNAKNISQSITEVEEGDLLGLPNFVNPLQPPDVMPETTFKDFQTVIEKLIIEKGYTESSISTPVSEETVNLSESNDIKQNSFDTTSSNPKTKEPITEEILLLPYPEHNLTSIVENTESTAVTESLPKDTTTTYYSTTNPRDETIVFVVKHGNSIVMDPNGDSVTVMNLPNNQNETSPDILKYNVTNGQIENQMEETTSKTIELKIEKTLTTFKPTRGIGEVFDKVVSSEEEDDGVNEHTNTILKLDPQTEEDSIETATKGRTESSDFDDAKTTSIKNFTNTHSNKIIQVTSPGISETATEKGPNSEKESKALNSIEGVKPNVYKSNEKVESDENKADEQSIPKYTLFEDKDEPSREGLSHTRYTGILTSSTEPSIIDSISIQGYTIKQENSETSEDEDIVTSPGVSETATEKGQTSEKESKALNSIEGGKPNVYKSNEKVESDENKADEQSIPKYTLFEDKDEPSKEDLSHTRYSGILTSSTEPSIIDSISTQGYKLKQENSETSEDEDIFTGEFSNLKPNKIKVDDNYSTVPLHRDDMDIQAEGSTLDNEIERDDTTPLHAVELFGGQGQGKGHHVNDSEESTSSKPSSTSDNKVGQQTSTNEPLTELCFPLMNEREVSHWDLLSGKLYLEKEGKKVLLKLKRNPLKNCNSGTRKCKLPFGFENTNKSVKETDSLEEGIDENDNEFTAKISKRSLMEIEERDENNKKGVTDHLLPEQNISYEKQEEISSVGTPKTKQIFLTDLLLMLLTNEISSNSSVKRCTRASMSTVEAADPGKSVSIVNDLKNPQPPLTLISFIKQISEDKNMQHAKDPSSTSISVAKDRWSEKRFKRTTLQEQDASQDKKGGCGCESLVEPEVEWSRKRFKRTILPQQDEDKDKEGGCGCGSMLGRTLPPIPNHDHFLGKRLNIITSIAHAIKDWAINRPAY